MEGRIRRISKQLGDGAPRGQIAFADLPSWPEEARAAFLIADAAGKHDEVDALVFERTGIRPTRGGNHINLIVDHPPEAIDPAAVIRAAEDIVKGGRS